MQCHYLHLFAYLPNASSSVSWRCIWNLVFVSVHKLRWNNLCNRASFPTKKLLPIDGWLLFPLILLLFDTLELRRKWVIFCAAKNPNSHISCNDAMNARTRSNDERAYRKLGKYLVRLLRTFLYEKIKLSIKDPRKRGYLFRKKLLPQCFYLSLCFIPFFDSQRWPVKY